MSIVQAARNRPRRRQTPVGAGQNREFAAITAGSRPSSRSNSVKSFPSGQYGSSSIIRPCQPHGPTLAPLAPPPRSGQKLKKRRATLVERSGLGRQPALEKAEAEAG
jgi:hypothetical protein